MLLHATLAFALFETLALAGVLLAWADRVAGARILAAFLTGIAAAYALGGIATLASEILVPAHLVYNRYIGWIAVADPIGVVASLAWVVLGVAGVAVLLRALLRAERPAFSQIAAVAASCLWGVACLCGYGMAVMDWPVYPFPLLGLPFYPVILVYGILRYGVFVANAWARRALVWTLLLALGTAVVALTPLLPFESRWLGGLAVAASCLALNGPIRRVAERLVYPGGTVTAADLMAWRLALQSAETAGDLGRQASAVLSRRIGTIVQVAIADSAVVDASVPRLATTRGPEAWTSELTGWDAAPPGPRHVAELFGSVVAEAAARVEQTQQIAARERERQLQARLAELGSLAATVAHDIRNPLNIIAMAVAGAPADTRREVADQVARIANLAKDLLDYAKPWKLVTSRFDLAAQVRRAALRLPDVSLGAGLDGELPVDADARRVEQALTNLFENARVAVGEHAGHVHVDAERVPGALRLHVCDNGPGVPAEIRERLFEPFASRSPGGTGLGLAIVARIMDAHGGSVALTERAPWRTCFTLTFPTAS